MAGCIEAQRTREIIENLRYLRDRDQASGDFCRNLLRDAAEALEQSFPGEGNVGYDWRDITSWEGQPTGQGHPVILCVSDGGENPPVVGEAWYDPLACGGSWWWANLNERDYHASPIIEMQHGVPTHWVPLPDAPPSVQHRERG